MDERLNAQNLRKTPKELNLVRMRGLEPPHLAAPEPKSGVSTNSTTSARAIIIGIQLKNVTYSFSACDRANSRLLSCSLRLSND